jgi:hypothetical protein
MKTRKPKVRTRTKSKTRVKASRTAALVIDRTPMRQNERLHTRMGAEMWASGRVSRDEHVLPRAVESVRAHSIAG